MRDAPPATTRTSRTGTPKAAASATTTAALALPSLAGAVTRTASTGGMLVPY